MVFGPPALGLDVNASVAQAPGTSVQAYGRSNASCLAWTDSCVTCTAGSDQPQCSTPGIACTPKPVSCTSSKGP